MRAFLLVCCGGALGSGLRYALSQAVSRGLPALLPLGTLAVNLIGCFLMGGVVGLGLAQPGVISPGGRLLVATGFLGGFTTYSAFNADVLRLWQEGAGLRSAGYVLLTLLGGLLAGILGNLCAVRIFCR